MSNVASDLSRALAAAVASVGDGLVRVAGAQGGCGRTASGVVWSNDGVVVTAAHAVEGATEVEVAIGDRTLKAKVLGVEPSLDVAVLKVDEALTAARWRSDAIGVGEIALITGRPGKSVRAAFAIVGVAGDDVRIGWATKLARYVELDRGAPRGFAGGAVIDADGKVIGVASIGVARHAAVVLTQAVLKKVVDEIVAHGRVRRGYLGVGVQPARTPHGDGALVVAIEPGGAAERDGILVGDVLLSIEGEPVRGPRDLANVLRDRIDAKVTVRLVRGGAPIDVAVTTAVRP